MPKRIDRAHRLDAETARAALIGERAVDEAVAKHPLALVERRADGLVDMVGAGGREQQRLGLARPSGRRRRAAAARGSPRRLRSRPVRG